MKTFVTLAAIALAAAATPAMASTFSGPRLEVTAGVEDASHGVTTKDIQYGAAVGYDVRIGRVIAGVETGVDNVFDRHIGSVAARVGYVLNEGVMTYVKAGYSNWRNAVHHNYEGLRLGAGVEANLVGPVYGKVEYRHVDYGAVKTNGGFIGAGVRF